MTVPTTEAIHTSQMTRSPRDATKAAAMTTVSPGVNEPTTNRFSKTVKPNTMT